MADAMRAEFDSDCFAQVVSSEICSYQFEEEGPQVPDHAQMQAVQLDLLNLVLYEGQGVQWGARRQNQIRVDQADYFVLSMPLAARLDISQDGLDTQLQPGGFVFVATARPSQALIRSLGDRDKFRSLHIRIPGAMLRRRIATIDELCNREIPLQRGAGNVLSQLLETTMTEAAHFDRRQAGGLGAAVFEAICSVAVPAADALASIVPARTPALARIHQRAIAYIEAHLGDADLDVERIAAHCRVSVRYLHAAFAPSAESVAGYIREQRLQGCRMALQSPALRLRPIIQIAGDWGFDDPSHFSHLYKARFGNTPRQERSSH